MKRLLGRWWSNSSPRRVRVFWTACGMYTASRNCTRCSIAMADATSASDPNLPQNADLESISVPEDTICVGFTLSVTTVSVFPQTHGFVESNLEYVNTINSLLLCNSIRGVLVDKSRNYSYVCNCNFCFQLRVTPLIPRCVKHSSPCCSRS